MLGRYEADAQDSGGQQNRPKETTPMHRTILRKWLISSGADNALAAAKVQYAGQPIHE